MHEFEFITLALSATGALADLFGKTFRALIFATMAAGRL